MSDPAELTGMALECSLSADGNEGSAKFTYEVTNAGDDPIDLQFSDGQEADLAVEDPDGNEVWRWSAGRMFAQMLQQKELGPGETATYEFEWENAAPGEYEATATLEATNADCDASAAFEV